MRTFGDLESVAGVTVQVRLSCHRILDTLAIWRVERRGVPLAARLAVCLAESSWGFVLFGVGHKDKAVYSINLFRGDIASFSLGCGWNAEIRVWDRRGAEYELAGLLVNHIRAAPELADIGAHHFPFNPSGAENGGENGHAVRLANASSRSFLCGIHR